MSSRLRHSARRLGPATAMAAVDWHRRMVGWHGGRALCLHSCPLSRRWYTNESRRRRRVILHRRIGARLEAAYGARAGESSPPNWRCTLSKGETTTGRCSILQQAARMPSAGSAHREAISHLTKALELLQTLPDTPERAQQELTLQTTLGPVLMATKGYAAPEVERVYTRARQLCQEIGETPAAIPCVGGPTTLLSSAGRILRSPMSWGCSSSPWHKSLQDHASLLEAHSGLGIALFYLGDFIASREHWSRGWAITMSNSIPHARSSLGRIRA